MLEDWIEIVSKAKFAQSAYLSESMNVLRHQENKLFPEAIWGFERISGVPRFFFFGGRPSDSDILRKDRIHHIKWKFFGSWIPYLSSAINVRPDFETILDGLKYPAADSPISERAWRVLLGKCGEKLVGEWHVFEELIVFAVYRKRYDENTADLVSFDDPVFKRDREEIASSYYDQHNLKQSINRNIPWKSIYNNRKGNHNSIISIFLDPKSFNPESDLGGDKFIWPWQRCISVCTEKNKKPNLEYSPIKTASLVCDLRFSTAAMQLFLSPQDYAVFICLLYTSPSPRDRQKSRMPSSA